MRGKTISIYIPDANPRGIKICEITSSIAKAIFIPRNKLEDASKRKELKDPGVYFLIGDQDELGKPRIYIGEAEALLTRLKQHNSSKDFWNSAICIISEKNNINKAHIKYLENYCCAQAKMVNKCSLENSVIPTQSSLTEQDEDFILSFYDDLKILIGVLGYPIFEETKKDKKNTYICKGKLALAKGAYSEDGFTVFKDSKINLEETNTIGVWATNLRKNLVDKKLLIKEGDTFILTEDYMFKSPSAASAIILGRSSNGWNDWKNEDGKTLDENIRQEK
jgi:hypothetical protein